MNYCRSSRFWGFVDFWGYWFYQYMVLHGFSRQQTIYISQVGSVFFCDEDTTKSSNRWIWRRFSLISEPQERTRGWSDEKAPRLIRFPTADFLMWESSGNATGTYPLVNVNKKLWKITMFNGKIHYFYGHFQ